MSIALQTITDLPLTADPTAGAGVAAPLFTRGIYNGVSYIKLTAADTGWSTTLAATGAIYGTRQLEVSTAWTGTADGVSTFTTIGAAETAAASLSPTQAAPVVILIHTGTYTENVTHHDFVHLKAVDDTPYALPADGLTTVAPIVATVNGTFAYSPTGAGNVQSIISGLHFNSTFTVDTSGKSSGQFDLMVSNSFLGAGHSLTGRGVTFDRAFFQASTMQGASTCTGFAVLGLSAGSRYISSFDFTLSSNSAKLLMDDVYFNSAMNLNTNGFTMTAKGVGVWFAVAPFSDDPTKVTWEVPSDQNYYAAWEAPGLRSSDSPYAHDIWVVGIPADTGTGAVEVDLPQVILCPNREFLIWKTNSGGSTLTVKRFAGDTIDKASSDVAITTKNQKYRLKADPNDTNNWIIIDVVNSPFT